MYNKKAAIGATMTWIVATIIILFVIILFVYASGAFISSSDKSFKTSPFNVATEQSLLALLETKLDGKTVRDYIIEGDYKTLRKKITPILERLPENSLKISENGSSKVNVGAFIALSAFEDRGGGYASTIYLDKNKKIEFMMRYVKK